MKSAVSDEPTSSFLARNEFLIRRLHSLSGMIPVGAYMVIHLLTNASVLDSPATFQRNVYAIHSLGRILPVIEWGFIFLPILFHAIIGVLIIRGSLPNSGTYKYGSNLRYTLQRATGMVAFVFILVHVFHMHGWFHAPGWLDAARKVGGAQFDKYHAASTTTVALASIGYQIFYVVGVLSCVFHLANGIWTFGITWGIWVTPASQRWATTACLVFGLGLSAVGLGALGGFAYTVDVEKAYQKESEMYEQRLKFGDIDPNEEERAMPTVQTTAKTSHPQP